MSQIKISVAMCTHNGARFLREQLESIAAQVRLPDELVVCDDRSTDETVKILERFAHRAPFPVRLEINRINLGSTPNFELAISLCQSEIIALCDQDDLWNRQKLSCVEDVFARDERIGAVFSNASLIDQNSLPLAGTLWRSFSFSSRKQRMFERGEGLRVLLKQPVVTGATMAFLSKFRDLVLPIPLDHVHDRWISFLIACVSHVAPIQRKLLHYRKHSGQQIGPAARAISEQLNLAKRTGRSYYLREAQRWNEMRERLATCSATFHPHTSAGDLISQKIYHQEARGTLPSSKLRRLPLLLEEVASLRYWRYSNGVKSVAKDFLM